MNYIIGADKAVKEQLRSVKYTDNPKTWDVSDKITIAWDDILLNPPSNDSDVTKKELVYLSELTRNRSNSQVELIKLVDKEPNDLYHKTLKRLNLEFPQDIFDKSWSILKNIIKNLKHQHNRPRPYQISDQYGIAINLLDSKNSTNPCVSFWSYSLRSFRCLHISRKISGTL